MSNRRIYYACQAVGVAPFEGTPTAFTAVRGLQSVGVNTTFNLEQVFEVGQLAIYENIENIPDVEITLEKVLDGYPPLTTLLTQGASASTVIGRSNQRANVSLSLFGDTAQLASGTPLSQCVMSGVYLSQVAFDIAVEGNARESVTAVGNNKVWATGSFTFDGMSAGNGVTSLSPAAPEGVNRRQDLVMTGCRFPTDIRGISPSGTNDDVPGSGMFSVAIQSVKVSANLGRQQLLELGRRGPYFRYITIPFEVTTAIEVNAKEGDFITATEEGVYADGSNVLDQSIVVVMKEGLHLDLGAKNKLNSVSYGGGNAGQGGGTATITYNYTTFNDFDIKHPADPTAALRP